MIIEIKNRFTGSVLFSTGVDDSDERPVRTAVMRAVAAGADLAGADLADADLAGAYLAGADLARADLADAYLADADLAGAYLAGADLARADLAGAYLADAYLTGADLAGADLAGADLAGAYLAGANLAHARNLPSDVTASDPMEPYVRAVPGPDGLAARAKRYQDRHPEVPVVAQLDARILDAITTGGGSLAMADWHTCETTHCRAGWAIHLAGKAGYELERKFGDPRRAGAAIYRASTGRVPHFFATDRAALEDIKHCAAEQTAAVPEVK